jgi:hypothetical protein
MSSPKRKQPLEHHPVFHSASARHADDVHAAKQGRPKRLLPRVGRDISSARAMLATISPAPEVNVVGVGIGEKLVLDRPTGVRALKFLVRAKYLAEHMSSAHVSPKQVDGLPTDVDEVSLFRRFRTMAPPRKPAARPTPAAAPPMPDPRQGLRPAQPGCSVGFQDTAGQFLMAGAFGALVKEAGGLYVPSNNHVLADAGRLPVGSPIDQPRLLDGAHVDTDQIAAMTRLIPLQAGVKNKVDCAIARAVKPTLWSRDILFIGRPQGVGPAAIDMVVNKSGRTTGYRAGRVTSMDTDVTVQYETGAFTFEGQIIIVGLNDEPFSDAGDSGSLILERQSGEAVALLFGGSTTHTIANHLEDVLQALAVTQA